MPVKVSKGGRAAERKDFRHLAGRKEGEGRMISQKEKEIGSGGRRNTFSRLSPLLSHRFAQSVGSLGGRKEGGG